ncbi:MAG TPA: hypothetical protein VIV60_23355, partial [Polyangiaceae bacterium]
QADRERHTSKPSGNDAAENAPASVPPLTWKTELPTPASVNTCSAPCTGCKVLYDPEKFGMHSLVAKPRELSATERMLVRSAYEQYLASDECVRLNGAQQNSNGTVAARATRRRILDVLDGAFTGPKLRQTLVLVDVGNCGNDTESTISTGQRLLILVQEGKALNTLVDDDGERLWSIDMQNDGIEEVIAWEPCFLARERTRQCPRRREEPLAK